jgi:murein DD-endopeptidase MepM/ murein hydrolase activator NlpD
MFNNLKISRFGTQFQKGPSFGFCFRMLMGGSLALSAGFCRSRSGETTELVLKGAVQESQEVVQLDPLFVARQKRAEQAFFGFDDSQEPAEFEESASAEASENSNLIPDPSVSVEAPSSELAAFGGALMWPLPGKITSPFGIRNGRLHAGLDLKGQKGDPIYAAAEGQVLLARRKNAYGNVVVLGHEQDSQTLYGHMLKIGVREGQLIKKGAILGYVGRTGRATGFHLHFETRIQGGIPKDPLRFLPHRFAQTKQIGMVQR